MQGVGLEKSWILYDTLHCSLKSLNISFSDFHGEPEIRLLVNKIELII